MIKPSTKLNISTSGIFLKAYKYELCIFIAEELSDTAIESLRNYDTKIGVAEVEGFPFMVIKTDKFALDTPMLFKVGTYPLKTCSIILVNPYSGKVKKILRNGIISNSVSSDITNFSIQRRKNFPSLDMAKIHIRRIYKEYSSENIASFTKRFCKIL